MKVSVIIPTYQGAGRVINTIRALENQTFRDFELVVVIDGSDDATASKIRNEAFDFRAFSIIEQPNKGRAGARNTGARVATGDILIFFDDDVVPKPDVLARHVDFHKNHSDAVLVGSTPQGQRIDASDFEHYRVHLSSKWLNDLPDKITQLSEKNLFVTSANLSIGRQLFISNHGFDENLRDAEDKELGFRLVKKGIPIYFDRNNVATHMETITCRSYIQRLRQYAEANRMVDVLHGKSPNPEIPSTTGPRRFFYSLLAFSWIVWVIDNFNIFVLMPLKMRYRIYDAVTFALSNVHPHVRI